MDVKALVLWYCIGSALVLGSSLMIVAFFHDLLVRSVATIFLMTGAAIAAKAVKDHKESR
jgi:hypothetical protein